MDDFKKKRYFSHGFRVVEGKLDDTQLKSIPAMVARMEKEQLRREAKEEKRTNERLLAAAVEETRPSASHVPGTGTYTCAGTPVATAALSG